MKYIETEPFHIKYRRKGEKFDRRYCPDILIKVCSHLFLIEIKPSHEVESFIKTKRNYIREKIKIITEKILCDRRTFNEYFKRTFKQ